MRKSYLTAALAASIAVTGCATTRNAAIMTLITTNETTQAAACDDRRAPSARVGGAVAGAVLPGVNPVDGRGRRRGCSAAFSAR